MLNIKTILSVLVICSLVACTRTAKQQPLLATLPERPRLQRDTASVIETESDVDDWFLHDTGIPLCCDVAVLTDAQKQLVNQLRQAEYFDPSGQKFQLEDGVDFYDCGLSIGCYTYIIQPAAFGDLNADGVEDVVVMFQNWTGGSGIIFELAAFINQEGKLHNVGTEYLGDRVKVTDLRIESQIITLDIVVQGEADPSCCPTQAETWHFKVANGQLQLLP